MHNQPSGLCFSTCALCCIKTAFGSVKFSQTGSTKCCYQAICLSDPELVCLSSTLISSSEGTDFSHRALENLKDWVCVSVQDAKLLLSLVPGGSVLPTSPEEQSSISQRRRKCRAATPNFSQLHTSSDLDLHQILQGRKTSAWSKAPHYIIYREMFTLKQPTQKMTIRRLHLSEKIDLIRLIQG